MATKQHNLMSGADLHVNKLDATTGTELTPASQTTYDARWVKTTGGTITPASNSTTTFQVTKADGTTKVFDVDTMNGRVGVGTISPNATLSLGTNLGDKLALYDGGASAIYGFAVIATLLKIFAPLSSDRVGIGYGGNSASFVEILTVKGANVGVGATSPNSTLQLAGPIALAITTTAKTTTYTVTATDSTILGNTTGGAFTITLPTAVGCTGRIYTVKRTSASANNLTVGTTSSQIIDGATTKTLGAQFSTLTVQSDNVGWQIIGLVGTVT